jgi:hypothetical protein
MGRDSFILYTQQYESVKLLSLEDKGRLFDAVFQYAITGEVPANLPAVVAMAFSFIRSTIDRNEKRYNKKCERNRENINKRWEGKKNKDTNVYERIRTNTIDTNAYLYDNDNDNIITDINNTPPISPSGGKRVSSANKFTIPSPDEVEAYCKERNNNISGSEFVDHYTSNGWMVGKNKMKDWKAAIRTWEQKRKIKEDETEKPTYNIITAPAE